MPDSSPGFCREPTRSGFRYRDRAGRVIRAGTELDRIRRIRIPPAWTDVWINPYPHGHLQATGRDGRKRKQYRYHTEWVAARGEQKYSRLLAFGKALPLIRRKVRADLRRENLPPEKVLAAIVRLLDVTHLRVGNDEYRRSNGSFGLSTLEDRHVVVGSQTIRVRFRGKSGLWHDRRVDDQRLARVVRACRDVPGQILFQYRSASGGRKRVTSTDVNAYIRAVAEGEFTAKDFRTWAGTVAAVGAWAKLPTPVAEPEKAAVEVVRAVAEELGNTPAVCRKYYIHPSVFDCLKCGRLRRRRCLTLSEKEATVLQLLNGRSKPARR
jgi:DNA topoisomerase-1